jgi:hypothetical protein
MKTRIVLLLLTSLTIAMAWSAIAVARWADTASSSTDARPVAQASYYLEGTLAWSPTCGCALLDTESDRYELDGDLQGFTCGDTVGVWGTLCLECVSVCMTGDLIILVESIALISPAPTPTPTATLTPVPTATPTPTPSPTPGPDTDGDGCADSEEPSMGYNPLAWYDVYDVPVPANPDMTANGPRNQAVAMGDVLAVLFYVGAYDGGPANPNGVAYDSVKGSCDWDADTVPDKEGLCYDRSPGTAPNPPWEVGPPNGAVNMPDVLAVLAQVGLSCA